MDKNRQLTVLGIDISVTKSMEEDYISLTDMVKKMDEGDQLIKKWLSTKNTVEFLGVWERLRNPKFNLAVFDQVKNDAGSNRFTLSVKKWVELTNGIGLNARSGRYNAGTFAHKDIAMKFAAWLSPEFELLLILEFQRLVEKEQKDSLLNQKWDIRRFVSKANYKIQTDAIKQILVPLSDLPEDKQGIIYAEEAELVNYAVFGITSKEWRSKNPSLLKGGHNIRDYANTHQLIVLSNIEVLNAELITASVGANKRVAILRNKAILYYQSLSRNNVPENMLIDSPNKESYSDFNKKLITAIENKPKNNE